MLLIAISTNVIKRFQAAVTPLSLTNRTQKNSLDLFGRLFSWTGTGCQLRLGCPWDRAITWRST